MNSLQLSDHDRTARAGHMDVRNDQGWSSRMYARQPGIAILGGPHGIPGCMQPLGHGFAHDCVVLDDEDVCRRRHLVQDIDLSGGSRRSAR